MNETDQGTVEQRCRRCGRVVDGVHVPHRVLALVDLIHHSKITSWPGNPQHLLGLHQCPDGGEGLTDVIGVRPDAAEAATCTEEAPCRFRARYPRMVVVKDAGRAALGGLSDDPPYPEFCPGCGRRLG